MLVPRSAEAVFAFFEAQDGLDERRGNNRNWISEACQIIDAWCVMGKSVAYLAAGFNTEGKILDFAHAQDGPGWAQPGNMPQVDGLGYRQRYRWGCAYTWDEADFAAESGRWTTDLDAFVPGCTVLINHNGRGGARNVNSHTAVGIERSGGRTLTWNGNISNRIRQAEWSDNVVEGFAIPAFVTSPQEDDLTEPQEQMLIRTHDRATEALNEARAANKKAQELGGLNLEMNRKIDELLAKLK